MKPQAVPTPSRRFEEEQHTPWVTGEIAPMPARSRSLVAIVLSGLIVTLLVAMVMQRQPSTDDDEQLAAVMSAFPTEKEPVPMRAPDPTQPPEMDKPAHEKAPEPEIVEKGTPQPEIQTPDAQEPEVEAPVVDKPEAPTPTSPRTQPRRAQTQAQPRRPVQAQPQAPLKTPSEDLYETR